MDKLKKKSYDLNWTKNFSTTIKILEEKTMFERDKTLRLKTS